MAHDPIPTTLIVSMLRQYLNERIPAGGTEADTMFTDAELQDIIDAAETSSIAVLNGWLLKAAAYTDLVDTAEGTSKRAMSDLHDHAVAMVKVYSSSGAGTGTVTRIHQIERR